MLARQEEKGKQSFFKFPVTGRPLYTIFKLVLSKKYHFLKKWTLFSTTVSYNHIFGHFSERMDKFNENSIFHYQFNPTWKYVEPGKRKFKNHCQRHPTVNFTNYLIQSRKQLGCGSQVRTRDLHIMQYVAQIITLPTGLLYRRLVKPVTSYIEALLNRRIVKLTQNLLSLTIDLFLTG